MTVDELRTRLNELALEYFHDKKTSNRIQADIASLDSIMARNFDAWWNPYEKNYTQGL